MILQTVWNECVRFGGHINIQVSFKILRLEVQREGFDFAQSNMLSRGAVLRQLWTHAGSGV
jgi:hypothetical protein